MRWNKFEFKGKVYELSHLHPFTWYLTLGKEGVHPERKYRFNIEFSMHCFTKKLIDNKAITDEALFYSGPKETRLFCFERYELSKQLPEIINNIDKKPCWHTNHGHFFTIELQNQNGVKSDYEIYFDVHKSGKGWLTLIVKSAYVRDEKYGTTQPKKRKIRFSVITRSRFENKKLRRPR